MVHHLSDEQFGEVKPTPRWGGSHDSKDDGEGEWVLVNNTMIDTASGTTAPVLPPTPPVVPLQWLHPLGFRQRCTTDHRVFLSGASRPCTKLVREYLGLAQTKGFLDLCC